MSGDRLPPRTRRDSADWTDSPRLSRPQIDQDSIGAQEAYWARFQPLYVDKRPDSVDKVGPMWRIAPSGGDGIMDYSPDFEPAVHPGLGHPQPSGITSPIRRSSSTLEAVSSTVQLSVAVQRTHNLHTMITVMTE